jgi:hypothetical protein
VNTPTLDEVLEMARRLSIADQQRLVRLLNPPKTIEQLAEEQGVRPFNNAGRKEPGGEKNVEIKAGQRGSDSIPCLLCPVCSSDMVEMRRPKRRHLENGAEEVSIEFRCLMQKHSWNWLLSDWEGRIFFQVLENRETAK